MEVPTTERGNRYILVFQDFLTKWSMVYPMPDQKSLRIAELLVNEVIPQFGVPESLLSDRGTNLLLHLMTDVCRLLGIKKLNTTSHHPQCDRMVEHFNRTLKTTLRKYAAEFSTYQEPSGPTPMTRPVRNHHFSCTDWTVALRQKLHYYQLMLLNLQKCQTTEKSWYSPSLQPGGWLPKPFRWPRPSTRYLMITAAVTWTTRLETGFLFISLRTKPAG